MNQEPVTNYFLSRSGRLIAVRIEDDYLLTKGGHDHLSKLAPRTVKDIEEMMKLPSPLDAMNLPDLDKK